MHDPMTVAFEIRWPRRGLDGKWYGAPVVTIWHCDPERDGTDDSCGWFMRSRHGDPKVLERIARDFAFQWAHGVPSGWFAADGTPNYSPIAIALGMFRLAANNVFGHWSKRAKRFLRRHIFDILHFAENNSDSLYPFIVQPWGRDARDTAESRAREAAMIVYPWILRAERPWWRHPRWHFWHWHIQVHPLQTFRRWALSRCSICGKGFRWGEIPIGSWESVPPRWLEGLRGERHIRHRACDAQAMVSPSARGG